MFTTFCSITAPIEKSKVSVTRQVFAVADGCANNATLAKSDLAVMNAVSAFGVQMILRLSFLRESLR